MLPIILFICLSSNGTLTVLNILDNCFSSNGILAVVPGVVGAGLIVDNPANNLSMPKLPPSFSHFSASFGFSTFSSLWINIFSVLGSFNDPTIASVPNSLAGPVPLAGGIAGTPPGRIFCSRLPTVSAGVGIFPLLFVIASVN